MIFPKVVAWEYERRHDSGADKWERRVCLRKPESGGGWNRNARPLVYARKRRPGLWIARNVSWVCVLLLGVLMVACVLLEWATGAVK